jgi:hypothetical protein
MINRCGGETPNLEGFIMRKLILLFIVLAMSFVLGACAQKQVEEQPEPVAQEEDLAIEEEGTEMTEEEVGEYEEGTLVEETEEYMSAYAEAYANLPRFHTVVKGECLWCIAEYEDIYNDPFMWPLIFKANRDQINDPDLIYPDQTFSVPRTDFDLEELKQLRKSAGAPWDNLEPAAEAKIPPQLREALGYSMQ